MGYSSGRLAVVYLTMSRLNLQELAFIIPGGTIQAFKEEQQPTVQPNYDTCEL